MTDVGDIMNTALPSFVTEVHRYIDPDSYGFITLEPDATSEWSIYPFSKPIDFADVTQRTDKSLRGPNYKNPVPAKLMRDELAKQERIQLHKNGYWPVGLGDPRVPENFRRYVIHQQAPIEWRSALDHGDEEVMSRFIVWVKGDFPGQDHEADLASLREKYKVYRDKMVALQDRD